MPGRSEDFDGNTVGVRCERFEVGSVSCQHSSTRLGKGDAEGVDRRSGAGESGADAAPESSTFVDGPSLEAYPGGWWTSKRAPASTVSPPTTSAPLEVGVVTDDDGIAIIHAMPARNKFLSGWWTP